MPSYIVRTRAAASHVCLAKSTLEKMRIYGGGPRFIRIGARAVAYDVRDLDAWLESRKASSTSEVRPRANTPQAE
jgi:predicted DNA-binding transcriptional regulator AlpA